MAHCGHSTDAKLPYRQVYAGQSDDRPADHQDDPGAESVHQPSDERGQRCAEQRAQGSGSGDLRTAPAELLRHGHHEDGQNRDCGSGVGESDAARRCGNDPTVVQAS